MHYCINSLLEINNEIMQYCIIINDIALIMHYRALLKGSDVHIFFATFCKQLLFLSVVNIFSIRCITQLTT